MQNKVSSRSLADLLRKIERTPDTNRRQLRERRAAIRRLSKWSGLPPSQIPASPQGLRAVFDRVHRSGAGVRPHTIANVKYCCLDLLTESGINPSMRRRGQRPNPIHEEWSTYYQRLPTKYLKVCLTRLVHYFDTTNILPPSVDDAAFLRFASHVEETSLQANFPRMIRDAARAWNEATRLPENVLLQPVTVPASQRARKLLATEDLLLSLQRDITAFEEWAAGSDIFSQNARKRQLSRPTCRKIIQDIRRAVTLAVQAGVSLQTISDLRSLVSADNFTIILRQAHAEKKGKPSAYNFQMALSLMVIGRDFLKLDAEHVARLKELTYTVPRPPQRITNKNTQLIMRFDDPQVVRKLVEAPKDLWKLVRVTDRPNRWTLAKAQAAIALAMLPVIPLRLGNLTALAFDEHIFVRPKGYSTLTIPSDENKSGTALAFDIPPDLVAMLTEYREILAPKIIGHRPRYLFCRDDGELKNFATVRSLIQGYIRRYLGFHMNPHAFRHLAAKITLDQDPGAHGQVQQFLGHKNMQTTEKYYVNWDTKRAQRKHIENLEKALADAQGCRRSAGKRKDVQ
ncbi:MULTISPECIES: site-specific integrase [Pseudorhizobium]|uniref:Tyrosine recombinase XerC n=1 Tax=Pseudorhizobium halotolerans TaxID=1233081 RepID=A0ABN7JUU0_9HYPH|nr:MULTISPECIES: site-specific integrase [Pseudorhizobium]CAD7044371.1 Tyrosine recombinase XerC [Pseudorhizobium halotolerans]